MILRIKLIIICLKFFVASSPLIPYGSQQHYAIEKKVSVKNLHHVSKHETSYTFYSDLKINSVWNSNNEQILEVYFANNRVSVPNKKSQIKVQELIDISDRPFYITFIDNIPSKVIAHTSRDQSLLNIKRAIASVMQIHFENGLITEADISGTCNNFYSIKSSTKVNKIKSDCSNWDLKVNYRGEKSLGVNHNSLETVEYELSADGLLLTATSTETHKISLEAKPEAGSYVESLLIMKHKAFSSEPVEQLPFKSSEDVIKNLLDWYRVFGLEADVDGKISELKDVKLSDKIESLSDRLKNDLIGKESLAEAFVELISLARITKKEEFVNVLRSNKGMHFHLVDLLGATQTIEAHNAINEVFDYNSKSDEEFIEKYLQSLSVGTHPERAIIEQLFNLLSSAKSGLQNQQLEDSILQCVASLSHQSGFDAEDDLFKNIRQFILNQLVNICDEVFCKIRYLRALQNFQDPSTISILLNYAHITETKTAVAAMQALKSFSVIHFNEVHRKAFENIFYQIKQKYDSSIRILSLDILLALKPTPFQLGHLLDYLVSNDNQFEIKTYVIQKLNMLSEKCTRFRALLKSTLFDRPHVNNYNILGQREYLNFGGTEKESKQAQYYMSVDSGANTNPTVELARTPRSFWKLLKFGLFGEGRNCCTNCNYNDENLNNYDSGNSLLPPFQPWHPIHLWRPLEPLFKRLNCDKCAGSSYGCDNLNRFGNAPSYSINTHSDNSVNTSPSYDNSETPLPLYKIPAELAPVESDYQLDNSPISEDAFNPASELESVTYTNAKVPNTPQQSTQKVAQIIYQPIIYLSPQYQESKALNQVKQGETKYSEIYQEEQPVLAGHEFKQPIFSSINDKSKLNYNHFYTHEEEEEHPVLYSHTPVPSLNYPPASPSVSSVSTVYNIITPSLFHTLPPHNVPCLDGGLFKYSMHPSNHIPLDNYPSNEQPNMGSLTHPIFLTNDDQPYRVCPELFTDYKRKTNIQS